MPAPLPEIRYDDVARTLIHSILAVQAAGYVVIPTADPHVVCVSSYATRKWLQMPCTKGVSPTGAAILVAQPEALVVYDAEMEALGVSAPWIAGFDAGVSGELPHATWKEHIAVQLIEHGYEMGKKIRAFLTRGWCELHNGSFSRHGQCPQCQAGTTPYDPHFGAAWRAQ